MTGRIFHLALAFALFAATAMAQSAQAQTLIVGPGGGVQYGAYGQGYYGGYGQGYRSYGRVHAPRVDSYTVYGNGPYGYGSGSQFQFPARSFYGSGIYNGFAGPGLYPQPYVAPVYNPYGFSYGSSF